MVTDEDNHNDDDDDDNHHKDENNNNPLQDTHTFYLGSGYFINHTIYMNLIYSYVQSKFKEESSIHSIGSTFYYKINETWFLTLLYTQEIDSHEEHNAFNFKLGYKVW